MASSAKGAHVYYETCIHTYTHTYIHTHTLTHTHTYIHTDELREIATEAEDLHVTMYQWHQALKEHTYTMVQTSRKHTQEWQTLYDELMAVSFVHLCMYVCDMVQCAVETYAGMADAL